MVRIAFFLGLGVALLLPIARLSADHVEVKGDSPFAYVTNEGSDSVSVIDMSRDAVVATIPVGRQPRWVTMPYDMTSIFVSNHAGNTVSVISPREHRVIDTISVGSGPCWLEPVSQQILSVNNLKGGSTSFVSIPDNKVLATVEFGDDARTNWNKPATSRRLREKLGFDLVVSVNEGLDNIAVVGIPFQQPFNADAFRVQSTIPIGKGPRWIDVVLFPDHTLVYVSNGKSNTVSVVDIPSYKVVDTIKVGDGPYWIRITSNGRYAYVVNRRGNSISKISLDNNEVVATIAVGKLPHWVAISPDGSSVYVPNRGSDTVSIISVEGDTVVTTKVGKEPNWISFSPDGKKAYVVNKGSGTVSVISTAELKVVGTINVGESPNMIRTAPHVHVHSG